MSAEEKMTEGLTLNRINRQWLEWTVKKPPKDDSIFSPVFWLHGIEWYFELHCESNEYDIYMENESKQELPHALYVTSFVDVGSELRCVNKKIIKNRNTRFGLFPCESGSPPINSFKELTFVFIFEGDIGLTLDSGKEKDVDPKESPNPHSNSCLECLSTDFCKLLDKGSYHDMEFQCPDSTFKAHKSVVSTRSDVFSAMLQSDMVEGQTGRIQIPDLNSKNFKQLLRYVYTGQLPEMTLESATCFYGAGDKYAIKGLMVPCADFLTNNLSNENACEMLILADAHNDLDFKETVTTYILDHDIPLQTENWREFCKCQPTLALEVLNLSYTKQKSK